MVILGIALVVAATAGVPSATPGGLAAAPAVSVENRVLAAQPGNTLTVEMGTQTSFTAVDRNHVQGRAVDLQRAADHLRGFVGDEATDLQLAPNHITGRVGALPVSLDVARTNGALDVHGVFGAPSRCRCTRTVSTATSGRAVIPFATRSATTPARPRAGAGRPRCAWSCRWRW